jgi:hypothetical protein
MKGKSTGAVSRGAGVPWRGFLVGLDWYCCSLVLFMSETCPPDGKLLADGM